MTTSMFTVHLVDRCEDDDALLELSDRIGDVTTECSVTVQHGETLLEFALEHKEPLAVAMPELIRRLFAIGLTPGRVIPRDEPVDQETINDVNAALQVRRSPSREPLARLASGV